MAAAKPLIGDRWTELMTRVVGVVALGTKHQGVDRATYRARMALAVELLSKD